MNVFQRITVYFCIPKTFPPGMIYNIILSVTDPSRVKESDAAKDPLGSGKRSLAGFEYFGNAIQRNICNGIIMCLSSVMSEPYKIF